MIAVVVPAFREERLIAQTIRSIPPWVDQVIVVDDCSDDATVQNARAVGDPRAQVVLQNENRGVGAAIVTGYRSAFARNADIAIVMAGDAQMSSEDLPALIEPLLEGHADYAKGNRLLWPDAFQRMPLTRFIGNHCLSVLTRVATGLRLGDSQCGYTAMHRRCENLPLDELWPRYGYPNDLLGMLARFRFRVVDVPVRPVYADEKSGVRIRHALVVIPALLARVVWRRFRGPSRRSSSARLSTYSHENP